MAALFSIEPLTAYLPSGVTNTLCTLPSTGMLFTRVSKVASITSMTPGSVLIPTSTRPPSLVMARLFGRALREIFFSIFPLFRSTTSSTLSDSLLT